MDASSTAQAAACASFLVAEGANYVLLDAARDPAVREFLLEHAPEAESLYAGLGEDLADVAPYLVPLTPERISALVPLAWGNSWGVFIRTDSDAGPLRRHFRRFLFVEFESGEQVYFRFYDPRVLRVFLPTCTSDEWLDFFGQVQSFSVEGDDSTVVLSFDRRQGPEASRHQLTLEPAAYSVQERP